MKRVSKKGLGAGLFAGWRYVDGDKTQPNPDFVLNQPAYRGTSILLGGVNFGCGSSREHAAWALLDYGIRAVISTEIADIFRNNSLKNGLVPIIVDCEIHRFLLDNPGIEIEVDVAEATLALPDGRRAGFPIDAFARYCLVEGIDQLGYLRKHLAAIQAFEEMRTWTP
jgi:3-isopropylmalate/(R)-2-methylmalate dehydratase small subunit